MAIIRYRVEAKILDSDENYDNNVIENRWQYEEINHPEKGGKVITREEAMDRIKEQGLVLVHRNMYGAIYDHPDEPLLEKFEGYYSKKKSNFKDMII